MKTVHATDVISILLNFLILSLIEDVYVVNSIAGLTYYYRSRLSMSSFGSSSERYNAPRKKEYRSLKPIASLGKYSAGGGGRESYPSIFLGLRRMEVFPLVEEGNPESKSGYAYVARSIVPVPIRQELESCFQAAMTLPTTVLLSWPKGALTDRDGGFFDWLSKHPYFVTEENATIRKKYLYEYINGKKGQQQKKSTTSSSLGGIRSIFGGFPQSSNEQNDALDKVASRASSAPPLALDTSLSPYHEMLEALDTTTGLRISGLLLEVADRPASGAVITGGAVLLVPAKWEESVYQSWVLKSSTAATIIKATQSQKSEAYFVKCHTDELAGFAAALANPYNRRIQDRKTGDTSAESVEQQRLTPVKELPIIIESTLFESLAIDGLIEKLELEDGGWETRVTAPYIKAARLQGEEEEEEMSTNTSNEDTDTGAQSQIREKGEKERSENKEDKKIKPPKKVALESASDFLEMTISQKREWLRKNGVRSYMMPRPREGMRAVDAVILPMLDLDLSYEILRRLGETKGDAAAAAAMADFQSNKPRLAREITVAQARGDDGKVSELTAELNSLSTLSYNPFEPDSAQSVWDVEKWYWEERKKRRG